MLLLSLSMPSLSRSAAKPRGFTGHAGAGGGRRCPSCPRAAGKGQRGAVCAHGPSPRSPQPACDEGPRRPTRTRTFHLTFVLRDDLFVLLAAAGGGHPPALLPARSAPGKQQAARTALRLPGEGAATLTPAPAPSSLAGLGGPSPGRGAAAAAAAKGTTTSARLRPQPRSCCCCSCHHTPARPLAAGPDCSPARPGPARPGPAREGPPLRPPPPAMKFLRPRPRLLPALPRSMWRPGRGCEGAGGREGRVRGGAAWCQRGRSRARGQQRGQDVRVRVRVRGGAGGQDTSGKFRSLPSLLSPGLAAARALLRRLLALAG